MSQKKGNTPPAPLVKCLLCGETIKVTKWRKHLARLHNVIDNPIFRDYFVLLKSISHSKIKCRLCNQIISLMNWEYHLRVKHGLRNEVRLKDFYISTSASAEVANRTWYNPQTKKDLPCGTVVTGPPPIKIIYNPIFSSRKKF